MNTIFEKFQTYADSVQARVYGWFGKRRGASVYRKEPGMYDMYVQRRLLKVLGSKRKKRKILVIAAVGVFFSVLAGVLVTAFLFAWYAKDLPRPDKVQRKSGIC